MCMCVYQTKSLTEVKLGALLVKYNTCLKLFRRHGDVIMLFLLTIFVNSAISWEQSNCNTYYYYFFTMIVLPEAEHLIFVVDNNSMYSLLCLCGAFNNVKNPGCLFEQFFFLFLYLSTDYALIYPCQQSSCHVLCSSVLLSACLSSPILYYITLLTATCI